MVSIVFALLLRVLILKSKMYLILSVCLYLTFLNWRFRTSITSLHIILFLDTGSLIVLFFYFLISLLYLAVRKILMRDFKTLTKNGLLEL